MATRQRKKPKAGRRRAGRPATIVEPVDRSIRLGAAEWAQLERIGGAGSWASRIRRVLELAS